MITLMNAYQSQGNQNTCINIMALEYNQRNQINCNFFVHKTAFNETTNILQICRKFFPLKNVPSKLDKVFYIYLNFMR